MRARAGDHAQGTAKLVCLVTCEHGGNDIPPRYAPLFRGHRALLASHRGYDPGALATARALARALDARLLTSTVSRLLVELNRSPGRQFRHSPVMHSAPASVRAEICREHYTPHWTAAESFVCDAVTRGRSVLHISSHSFTPSLDGDVRRTDVGLLYDPSREWERTLCSAWQRALGHRLPQWTTRRNYPYRGKADGLTRFLRSRFDDAAYCGIELEVNQKHVRRDGAIPADARDAVVAALRDGVAAWRAVDRGR